MSLCLHVSEVYSGLPGLRVSIAALVSSGMPCSALQVFIYWTKTTSYNAQGKLPTLLQMQQYKDTWQKFSGCDSSIEVLARFISNSCHPYDTTLVRGWSLFVPFLRNNDDKC